MFNSSLIYDYNDIASYFISALRERSGVNHFSLVEASPILTKLEPLNGLINLFFFKLFDQILAINLISIMYLVLGFTVSYILFKKISKNNVLSICFAFFNTFSIYNLYRIISFTTDLMQFFMFPLTIYLLYTKKLKPHLLALLCLVGFGLSIYSSFMCVVVILFWYLSDLFFSQSILSQRLKEVTKNFLLFLAPLFVVGAVLYSSVILPSLPYFARFTRDENKLIRNMKTKYRPIEDFYSLSFRPWYFVIPPKNSVFFGEVGRSAYKRISETGYFLADDYTEEEAAGSYLGWHFILGALFVYAYLMYRKLSHSTARGFDSILENETLILRLGLITILILLVSHPPTFTISGIIFVTPTYFIYKFLPVFRTLVRFSAFIYLFILIINLILYTDLYNKMTAKLRVLFVPVLLISTFVVMQIKLPIVDVKRAPSDIAFIKNYMREPYNFAVYPKGDYYSIFWLLNTKKLLINPVDFINEESGFDSNKFSKSLNTVEGLAAARSYEAKLLVVYKKQLPLKTAQKDLEFFTTVLGEPVFESSEAVIFTL